MFKGCNSTQLNLAKFHSSKAKDISQMFELCTSVRELKIENFNI